jgi:serine phosphatase RsbU (regulator of sigma subunit)/anti-sigma regulatory factor (Ser/Thr protein kinase)
MRHACAYLALLAARRWWPSPSVRRKMLLFGFVGVLLNLVVVQAAMAGLGRVNRANEGVSQIARAQRFHQDADMMHDALRADVATALLVSAGDPGGATKAQVLADTRVDAAEFRSDIRASSAVDFIPDVARSLAAVRPAQQHYIDSAQRIVSLAFLDRVSAGARLPEFTVEFRELQKAQRAVTDELAEEEQLSKAQATRDQTGAQRTIVLASLLSLLGLLGLTLMLKRVANSLAVMAARERGVAETLQRNLLPEKFPDVPGLTFAARYLPGGSGATVGGDWFDVVSLPGGQVGLAIGDVVGHDVRAAALMGQLRNAQRAFAMQGLPPSEVLGRLNELLVKFDGGEMATCLYALFDPMASTLQVASAGHPPPLTVSPGRVTSFVDVDSGPPLGALPDTDYLETLVRLQPGSTVLLFTDGLVERRGEPLGEALFRLRAAVAEAPAELEPLCDHLLDQFVAAAEPADDVALLVMTAAARVGDRLSLELPAEPGQLVGLRRVLGRWLDEVGADPEEAFDITVACCEAASNAIEHAYGPMSATFSVVGAITAGGVDLTVADHGRWRQPRGEDRGRGLALVHALMDATTVTRSAHGTTVWMHRHLVAPTARKDAVPA